MKILYYSHTFGSPTTTFIRNETDFFCKTNTIKYLCNSVYDDKNKPNYVIQIPFIENKIIKKIKWWSWKLDLFCFFWSYQFSKKINKLINEFKPDIIHCHFGYEALMLLDNLYDLHEHKIIIHFHGYDASAMTRKKSYVNKLKYYLRKENIFTISCNQFFLDRFKNELNINISHFFVLNYGINTENIFKISNSINSNNDRFIIQVSSLVEKKGHEYTIHAFKKIIEHPEYRDIKLLLTGEGKRKIELLELVYSLGLKSKVIFLGILSPKEVAQYLSKALVFVHHSITDSSGDMEGIPNSIMEGMAMELPIVSTLHSGIPELIEDGINGYLVKEKDIDNYALKIVDALKMGKLSINREKILNEYNIQMHNDLLAEFYKNCVNC
jgi:colanic acid/amylovoran biosynthesis glycosyltransferase